MPVKRMEVLRKIASPIPSCPVIREYLWKKTQTEKTNYPFATQRKFMNKLQYETVVNEATNLGWIILSRNEVTVKVLFIFKSWTYIIKKSFLWKVMQSNQIRRGVITISLHGLAFLFVQGSESLSAKLQLL